MLQDRPILVTAFRVGLAREFVSTVQGLRKEAELDVSDRIALEVSGSDAVRTAVEAHRDTICGETLCVGLRLVPQAVGTATELNGQSCVIALAKA